MRSNIRQEMAREVADWHHRGIIDQELKQKLEARYDKRGLVFNTLLRWLGFLAVSMLGSFILSLVAGIFQSVTVGAVFLSGFSFLLLRLGRKMAIDPVAPHPFTASLILAVSVIATYGITALLLAAFSVDLDTNAYLISMFVPAAAGFYIAYLYRLRAPLLVALLFLFHGLGSWHQYLGYGSYAFNIQDPKIILIFAGMAAAFGIYHELIWEEVRRDLSGFGHFYVVIGLVYFNVSLLILSVFLGGSEWVMALTLGSIAQIVAGARLKDSRLTGFGVVFLSIDMYTRMFEMFWDDMSKGLFLLIAGIIGISLGYIFEKQIKEASGTPT